MGVWEWTEKELASTKEGHAFFLMVRHSYFYYRSFWVSNRMYERRLLGSTVKKIESWRLKILLAFGTNQMYERRLPGSTVPKNRVLESRNTTSIGTYNGSVSWRRSSQTRTGSIYSTDPCRSNWPIWFNRTLRLSMSQSLLQFPN